MCEKYYHEIFSHCYIMNKYTITLEITSETARSPCHVCKNDAVMLIRLGFKEYPNCYVEQSSCCSFCSDYGLLSRTDILSIIRNNPSLAKPPDNSK